MHNTFYSLECVCGSPITVGIHQCGLDVACPACQTTQRTPDLKTLRARSGDPYPTLAAIRKIQKAIDDGLSPFDGRCVCCQQPGTVVYPIEFSELRERFVTDHGGFGLGLAGRIGGTVAADETREVTKVPMIVCDVCASAFEKDRHTRRPMSWMGLMTLLMICAVVQVLFEAVVLSGLVAVVGGLVLAVRHFKRVREEAGHPAWLLQWVKLIRWFPEAIRDAMTYRLTVHEPTKFVAKKHNS